MSDTLFDVEPQHDPIDELDLPPLRGSVRQEPWANDVRRKLLSEIGKLLRDWQRYVRTLADTGKAEKAEQERVKLRAAIDASERLLKRDTCRWWLDRRNNTARELLADDPAKPGGTYNQTEPY